MLAQAIAGDYQQSAATAGEIIAQQAYAQRPNLALLGQAYLHRSWAGYHGQDLDWAWQEYRKSTDKGAWE